MNWHFEGVGLWRYRNIIILICNYVIHKGFHRRALDGFGLAIGVKLDGISSVLIKAMTAFWMPGSLIINRVLVSAISVAV